MAIRPDSPSPASLRRSSERPVTRSSEPSDGTRGSARVARELTVSLDEFGWESLESQARRDGETLDEFLARAAAYFDAELHANRAATLVPKFRRDGQGTAREIRFEVSRACWEHLEAEAGRQGVPLERLLEHAALLHLADIDSGRVAKRVLGDEGPESARA
jgi:GNAT superfamily N-acetyltransferase